MDENTNDHKDRTEKLCASQRNLKYLGLRFSRDVNVVNLNMLTVYRVRVQMTTKLISVDDSLDSLF